MIKMTMIVPGLACILGAGCYVVPPVRVGAGGGGGAGDVVLRNSAGERREHGAAAIGQIRAAITPMALGQSRSRRGDLSLGWTLDWTTAGGAQDGFRHGPFAEGVWFLRQGARSDHQRWRFGPTALAELHFAPRGQEDEPSPGIGAAGGVLLEYVEAVRGPIMLGRAHGDLGVGIAARIGVRNEDSGNHGYLIVSVEFRWPGAAGFNVPMAAPR